MAPMLDIPPGFSDKVRSAQSGFRALMNAMARPGSVHRLAATAGCPAPLMPAAAAVALTLFDHDTPIWLDAGMASSGEVARWLKFHTAAPLVDDPSGCAFALAGDPGALPDLDQFALGSDDYPDRSTTLILQVESLIDGPAIELRGPGIDGTAMIRAAFAPRDLFRRLTINQQLFPRGIDVVLVAGDSIAAIPRTTRLVGMEA
jgi:alpha-D-ribose 1-methylphosphonate 5-triphosphate synthase subunit PhnH